MKVVNLSVGRGWAEAAERAGMTVERWIQRALDNAATKDVLAKRCPYGHVVDSANTPGGCFEGSCGWR